jgi:hypothetical protein
MQVLPRAFRSGDAIDESGIYRVCHSAHRLPHEVTLLRGEIFPRCARCGEHVLFYLVRPVLAPENATGFGVRLHELPELEDAEPRAG